MFFYKKKSKAELRLEKENKKLRKKNSMLEKDNKRSRKREKELVDLCNEKDKYFAEMISDGLKRKSPLAAKHMSDRKKYLKGK